MPFLLTPDGVAPRTTAGAALYSGGITEDIAAAAASEIVVNAYVPTVDVTTGGGVSVAPGYADLVHTGFSPSPSSTDHIRIIPSQGEIAQTGFAPTASITDHKRVLPEFSDLLVEGLAPSPTADASVVLGPDRAQIIATGLMPVAHATDHRQVLPVHSEIIVSGFVPAALAPRTSVASVSDISSTGFAPVLQYAIRAYPETSGLTIAGFVPLALAPRRVFPAYSEVVLSGIAPAVSATASRWVLAETATLAVSGLSPAVTADASIVAGPVQASFVISGMTATVAATDHKWTRPDVGAVVVSGFVSAIINPTSAAPGLASLGQTGFNPELGVSADRFAQPATSTVGIQGFPIAFVAPQTLWPEVAAILVAGQAPQPRAGTTANSGTFAMAVDCFDPGLEITHDQFARVPSGSVMAFGMDDPFIVLPRIMFPFQSALAFSGHVPLSHAIIPVALMDFTAVPGGEMTGMIVKHPWSEVRVSVNWGSYAARQQTAVDTSTWVETTDLGIVLDGPFLTNSVANVEIGGGEPASAPIVENRVTFADGSRDVFRVRVQVAGTS